MPGSMPPLPRRPAGRSGSLPACRAPPGLPPGECRTPCRTARGACHCPGDAHCEYVYTTPPPGLEATSATSCQRAAPAEPAREPPRAVVPRRLGRALLRVLQPSVLCQRQQRQQRQQQLSSSTSRSSGTLLLPQSSSAGGLPVTPPAATQQQPRGHSPPVWTGDPRSPESEGYPATLDLSRASEQPGPVTSDRPPYGISKASSPRKAAGLVHGLPPSPATLMKLLR